MEEPAAHNGSAAGAAPGAGTPARPPATPEGMALAYGSLVLMALLPIFFGALRSVSCAKSKVPPRLGAAGPIGLAPPQESPPGAPFHGGPAAACPRPWAWRRRGPRGESWLPLGLLQPRCHRPDKFKCCKTQPSLVPPQEELCWGDSCVAVPRGTGAGPGVLSCLHPCSVLYSSRCSLHFIAGT